MQTTPDPVDPLERFAKLSALLAAPHADRAELLRAAGLDAALWQEIKEDWTQRFRGPGGPALARRFSDIVGATSQALGAPAGVPAEPSSEPSGPPRLGAARTPVPCELEPPATLRSATLATPVLPADAAGEARSPRPGVSVVSAPAAVSRVVSTREERRRRRKSTPLARTLDVNERLPPPVLPVAEP